MARILVLDTDDRRLRLLHASLFAPGHHVQHASDSLDVLHLTSTIALAVVVVRDPLRLYLDAIRALRANPGGPQLLAVYGGGTVPADYALMAAQACGANEILYQPHSDNELVGTVRRMLGIP